MIDDSSLRYDVVVVTDAVEALNPSERRRELQHMKTMYGVKLANAHRAIGELTG